MYFVQRISDTIRVPPNEFSADLKGTILKLLREEYEGLLDEDLGIVVAVTAVDKIGEGKVIPGDGAAYYTAEADMLFYRPVMHEVVEGAVSEATEFGAFLRIGPMEGLIHVSQIMNDYINYDPKSQYFVGKESGKKLRVGDEVTARIVTISLKGSISASKIGLTMRQDGLGKEEWLKIDEKKRKREEKAKKGAKEEAKGKGKGKEKAKKEKTEK
jgi:DNA-directed RNA polymerase subunit E'